MRYSTGVAFAAALICAAIAAATTPPQKPASPRDMGQPPPVAVTRAFSDAWHLNDLRIQLLEGERDRIARQLGQLNEERKALVEKGRVEFLLDLGGGDTIDEKTLEIRRRSHP